MGHRATEHEWLQNDDRPRTALPSLAGLVEIPKNPEHEGCAETEWSGKEQIA
jgi:hypothetical protein